MRLKKAKIVNIQRPLKNTHRIYWISLLTGAEGHGSWLTLDEAYKNCSSSNRTCSKIYHWVEEKNKTKSNNSKKEHYRRIYADAIKAAA